MPVGLFITASQPSIPFLRPSTHPRAKVAEKAIKTAIMRCFVFMVVFMMIGFNGKKNPR